MAWRFYAGLFCLTFHVEPLYILFFCGYLWVCEVKWQVAPRFARRLIYPPRSALKAYTP